MEPTPNNKLDYASPATQVDEPRPSLRTVVGVLILSLVLFMTDTKINPGGPFVSLHAEVVPLILCLGLLIFGGRTLGKGTLGRRVTLAFLFMVTAGIMTGIIAVIWDFAHEPYSRGRLIDI